MIAQEVLRLELAPEALLQAANAEAPTKGRHPGRMPHRVTDAEYLSVGVHCLRNAFASVPLLAQSLDGLF
jgi:hypothetical protein